jgi:cyclohexanone monooxygenase
MSCQPTKTPDDVDIPALRAKYLEERDKRLRPEGVHQYVDVSDDFIEFYETDLYSAPVSRQAISDDIDVAVLGGGFAGLFAAARLKQNGVNGVRVIEMGGDFGGTWYWNRYPGVQCDVESYSYLPLLEELKYIPKERYSHGPEIYEHCQRIGRHFDLYKHALFGTIIRELRWDEAIKRWRVSTNHGDDIRARFVIIASGPLNKPKLPGIQGITTFGGHTFHTARWDYDYTGGDTFGGLTKLNDKRVAIIGTGATGIQCVPFLGRDTKHLYVIQRTPSYVDERGNRPTDPDWVKSLEPGWQAKRQVAYHTGVFGVFTSPDEDVVCDGWGEIARNLSARLIAMGNPTLTPAQLMELRESEDYRAMERIRRRTEDIVKDRMTAEALKPYYRFLCKRPCFNDEYLATFNRPNVTLVDVSSSKGVERITEKGFVANGTEYEVDCIIYASGFEVTPDLRRRFGISAITGRDGLSLFNHWAAGYRTLHGRMSRGFPNLFFTGYTQSAVEANITLMYDRQVNHIAYIVKETLARSAKTVEPTQEAQDVWVRHMRETALATSEWAHECTPGYYNNEGEATRNAMFGEVYGPGHAAFDILLAEWREKGDLAGLALGS